MELEKTDKIKFKYVFDPLYNPRFINGAYGGMNNTGEIVVHFFFERAALPYSQSFKSIEDRLKNEACETEPQELKNSMVRVVESGVILSYPVAKEINRFLSELIKNFEDNIQEQVKKKIEGKK